MEATLARRSFPKSYASKIYSRNIGMSFEDKIKSMNIILSSEVHRKVLVFTGCGSDAIEIPHSRNYNTEV